MSSKLFALFAFIAVLTVANCRVVREAPANKPVSEALDTIQKLFDEVKDGFFKTVGVKDSEELQKKATEQGKEFVQKLDTWAEGIKKETEGLKDNAAVKGLRETVDKAIEDFKQKNPETAEDVKNYIEKANKGTEEIIGKIKALSESDEAKNIKDLSKKLLDNAVVGFEGIVKDVQSNLKTQ